jgi:hypothetical protein
MRTIEDYYSRRARAALSGDTAMIFVAYPKLAEAEDRSSGINTDAFFVERMRNLGVTDVRFEIEERESARVYVEEGRAVAFVHGKETWRYRGATRPSASSIRAWTSFGRAMAGRSTKRMR